MAPWSGLQRLALIFSALFCGSQVSSQFCRLEPTRAGNAGGARCVFPFTYRNVVYNECTTIDHRWGLKWCSTTSNYDTDERWGECICDLSSAPTQPACVEKTVNGNNCARPFYYKGRAYYGCTAVDNNAVRWCSLDRVYNKRWENCAARRCPEPGCRSDITDAGNAGGAACVFPFTYRGTAYSSCIDNNNKGVKWCATTANYDVNKKWGRCICDVIAPPPTGRKIYCRKSPTVLGNSGGAGCVFPFLYRGVSYTECTVVNNNRVKWCATTSDYGRDKRWGNCICDQTSTPKPDTAPLYCRTDITTGGNARGRRCSFPFLYRNVIYNKCTMINNKNQPWCATTGNYDADRLWGNCICDQLVTQAPTVAQLPCRKDRTTGGNAGGAKCFLPFVYQRKTYYQCTNVNNYGERWCSTTPNYDIDKKWGNCICSAQLGPTPAPRTSGCDLGPTRLGNGQGAPCVIPFIYKGNTITDCTTLNNGNVYWCSVTKNYDIDRRWGNCNCGGAPTIGPPGPVAPCKDITKDGRDCTFPFIYNRQSYSRCITANNGNRPWCALTPNYDTDRQWAECNLPLCNLPPAPTTGSPVITFAPNPGPIPVTPSVAPPPSNNNCDVSRTTGGNGRGSRCIFPFRYNNQLYTSCITVNNDNKPWCAVSADYDRDLLWGNCICGNDNTPAPPTAAPRTTPTTPGDQTMAPTPGPNVPTPQPTPPPSGCFETTTKDENCQPSFVYNGVTYTGCTMVDFPGYFWCSLDPVYQGNYGVCKQPFRCTGSGQPAPVPRPTPAPRTTVAIINATPAPIVTPAPVPNPTPGPAGQTTPTTLAPTAGSCRVNTAQGPCNFPYRVNGVTYNNCTNFGEVNRNNFWCSLTENYNADGRRGDCLDFSQCRG